MEAPLSVLKQATRASNGWRARRMKRRECEEVIRLARVLKTDVRSRLAVIEEETESLGRE